MVCFLVLACHLATLTKNSKLEAQAMPQKILLEVWQPSGQFCTLDLEKVVFGENAFYSRWPLSKSWYPKALWVS